ncbi:hypothetical protein KW800_01975 [Candidatus Parcubacteria bacterium]|nr:hypothetical protein [Candidatus Parcubacteria bacterium]
MTKRRVIGLDFDDVLMDFRYNLDQYHNFVYGTSFKREDAVSHDLWIPWNCAKDEYAQRVFDFYESDHHHNASPLAGGPEAVKKLSLNNDIVMITSRPDHVKEVTLRWLEKHYPYLMDHTYFTNLFEGNGIRKKKSEVCAELGVDIFVDDYLGYANDIAESGREVLLFNAPWNQTTELHPKITRVKDWAHILEVLGMK